MKKRLLSLFLCATALISLFSINSFASFNSISSIYENKNQNTTTINTMSEYEIAVQESLQFQRSGQSGEDPLAAYERAFKKLCELPADMLMNNGYSSEEVSLMKAYLSGSVSFDVAAMRASASLSSDLRCTKHTSTQYTCVYSWEWDKIPAGEDTAGYALTMVGINENSQSIETKKVAQNSSVYYYYIKTNYPVTPRQKRSRCRSNRGIIDSPTPLFTPFCRFRYRSRGQIHSHQYPRTSSTNDPFLKWFSYASRMTRIAMSTSPF